MKRLALFLMSCLLLGGCTTKKGNNSNKDVKDKIVPGTQIQLTKDNFEYYFYDSGSASFYTRWNCFRYNVASTFTVTQKMKIRFRDNSTYQFEYVESRYQYTVESEKVSAEEFNKGLSSKFAMVGEGIYLDPWDEKYNDTSKYYRDYFDQTIGKKQYDFTRLDGVMVASEMFYEAEVVDLSMKMFEENHGSYSLDKNTYNVPDEDHLNVSVGIYGGDVVQRNIDAFYYENVKATFSYTIFNPDYSVKSVTSIEYNVAPNSDSLIVVPKDEICTFKLTDISGRLYFQEYNNYH